MSDMREWEPEMDATLKALGRVIAGERKKKGMRNQAQLAEAAGISTKQMGKIERGERGQFHETLRVAWALGESLSSLLAEAEGLARDDAGGSSREIG